MAVVVVELGKFLPSFSLSLFLVPFSSSLIFLLFFMTDAWFSLFYILDLTDRLVLQNNLLDNKLNQVPENGNLAMNIVSGAFKSPIILNGITDSSTDLPLKLDCTTYHLQQPNTPGQTISKSTNPLHLHLHLLLYL